MDLLLDVERRRVDNEIAPVLLILATPHELGIEVSVTGITQRYGLLLAGLDDRLKLCGRDVLPLGLRRA